MCVCRYVSYKMLFLFFKNNISLQSKLASNLFIDIKYRLRSLDTEVLYNFGIQYNLQSRVPFIHEFLTVFHPFHPFHQDKHSSSLLSTKKRKSLKPPPPPRSLL